MNDTILKESYGTLSETINGLIADGYTQDFNIKDECFVCNKTKVSLSPKDFQIDKVYRFEGSSDPDCQSILYAISSKIHAMKGTLVNAYGIYSNAETSKMIEKLETNGTENTTGNKSNEATALRPEGERVLNAPLVEMDLNKFMEQIKNESTWETSDRNSITIFKSESITMVLIALHPNAEMKPHKANGLLSVQVLYGKIEFSTDAQSSTLHAGQMIALQENITHSVRAVIESCFLLTIAKYGK